MEMAKANGWAVVCTSTNTSTVPIYSKYTRCTELRRVDDNDIYKLATILDVNGCWRKLMSIIPKRLDAQACSAPGALNYQEIAAKVGLKYTAQQISLIDGTAERLTPGQSISQVMIDEWKTSGKLNERPTVGVLLQLLVHAEIYSAADFVALHFLNEPKPERPTDGPAAHISLDLCSEDLSEDMDVEDGASYQPNTSALNAAVEQARGTGMNLDYFDKHMVRRDKSVPQQLENGTSSTVPVPPPRAARSSRLLKATASNVAPTTASNAPSASNTANVPNLSILNASSKKLAASSEQTLQPQNIPNLSILNGSSVAVLMATTSTTLDAGKSDNASNGRSSASTSTATIPNVPLITLLIENSSCEISDASDATAITSKSTATKTVPEMSTASYNNLPAISALNLNIASGAGELDGNGAKARGDNADNNSSGTNSLSNDDDDQEEDDDDDDDDDVVDVDDEEADVSLPNLSNSDHQTSNNDSSLTTVTCTSGENSFEFTNDSSSASNDDYTNNIPNLSELQQ
ncbi:protein Tube [Drosophila virilis]|uniref:Tube, isoform A n=1 Tax=Drosophila virilis TaxID=7244 RepID=B4LWB0_DROVI|nr:protein Tube [Drosophila virilis]XP_015027009.1 protein Tube [Drosophila virilis]EDW67644.1 tube, isoform A [Drosophila virilis]KRF83379.1 tube, isoform B [Drosophila virilis]